MTRDDIMRMAKNEYGIYAFTAESLAHFAALVAAAEREECAKVCDQSVDAEYATGKVDHNEIAWTRFCAIAIRARGESK